ncbi:MAG: hypothetical protein HOV81_18405 [Kofleriaceae bacterium]|nr:hypothetical protein [Kofleriaceae bacterium]
MALKSAQEGQTSQQQIEELLDAVDTTLDRLKTLYEQYFMGIQKQAPAFIHSDVERKLRDLTQMNVRNTGLRYRLATLQQKFGSYNSYWRRTLRQIENGTYHRNLQKIGRDAARTGAAIPEEILAAMPKRMREQVLRDRDAALAMAKRRNQAGDVAEDELLTLADEHEAAATIDEPSQVRRDLKTQGGAHILSEDDGDLNFDEFFSAFQDDAPSSPEAVKPAPAPAPAPRPQYAKPGIPNLSGIRIRPTSAPVPSEPPADEPRKTPLPSTAPPEPRKTPFPSTAPPELRPQVPSQRQTGPVQVVPPTTIPTQRATGPVPVIPSSRQTGPVPVVGAPAVSRQTGPVPVVGDAATTMAIPRTATDNTLTTQLPKIPGDAAPTTQLPRVPPTGAIPRVPSPPGATGAIPRVPSSNQTGPVPRMTPPAGVPRPAPSQVTRPVPVMPGSAAQTGPVGVESMSGPFPREKPPAPKPPVPPSQRTQAIPKPPIPGAPQKPPPGMTDADVNALHAKYVQAKQAIGEKVDAGSREKLLKTINQTAPKIMEQYKASGVDFSVVVKDNQVIIKAKPKT